MFNKKNNALISDLINKNEKLKNENESLFIYDKLLQNENKNLKEQLKKAEAKAYDFEQRYLKYEYEHVLKFDKEFSNKDLEDSDIFPPPIEAGVSRSNKESKINKSLYDLVKNNYDRLYISKKSLLSKHEAQLYKMIVNIVNENNDNKNANFHYVVFADVRLADFISLTYETYKKFKEFEFNEDLIEYINSENLYNELVKHPLLRMHVDFLICKKIDERYVPYLLIELFGEEHSYETTIIMNDKFKKRLFKSSKVNIKFRTVINSELDDEDTIQLVHKRIKEALN